VRLPPDVTSVLDNIAMEREISRSKVIVDICRRYASAYTIEERTFEPNDKDHYLLLAKTLWGKTFLVKHLIIPALGKKRIIALDAHGEYDFKPLPVEYDRTIPHTSNDMFQMLALNSAWGDVDRICRDVLRELQSSKENRSLRFNVLDPSSEAMLGTELLKRLTQTRWNPPILLVVEECNRFDCRALVSRGRHFGIQAVLLSQFRLAEEVMTNCKVLLGSISMTEAEKIDPLAGSAVLDLQEHEFLFEREKGLWSKFKFKPRGRRNG